jgi:hypothetical protein
MLERRQSAPVRELGIPAVSRDPHAAPTAVEQLPVGVTGPGAQGVDGLKESSHPAQAKSDGATPEEVAGLTQGNLAAARGLPRDLLGAAGDQEEF